MHSFGQSTEYEKLIELGKSYKDYMFGKEPGKEVIKELEDDVPKGMETATEFISQTITTKNKLLDQTYLARPNDTILKQLFIIRAISENLREENQISNTKLIDSLLSNQIQTYELVNNYYGMLFTAVGNKNKPFNMARVDLKLKDYNLKDDTEKGILVLRAISLCGTNIWGYMNIPKPPNTEMAYTLIKKFPKINGSPYYHYSDFYFADFEMVIDKSKGIQSYKSYYLNKYYETLIFHLICLNKENGSEKEKNDLLFGSILKENNLYKYTEYKKTLEGIFKEQKKK